MDYQKHLQNIQRTQDLSQINNQIKQLDDNINKLAKEIGENNKDHHPIVSENYKIFIKKILPMKGEFLKKLQEFQNSLDQIKNMDNIDFYEKIENDMQYFYKIYSFFHAQVNYYLERKSILNSEDQDADLRLIQDIIN